MPGAAGAVSPPAGHDACERAAQMPLALYQRAVEKRDEFVVSGVRPAGHLGGGRTFNMVFRCAVGSGALRPFPRNVCRRRKRQGRAQQCLHVVRDKTSCCW